MAKVLTPEEVAKRVRDLPAMPIVIQEILRITRDPESSVFDLAEGLARDQGLTAKVLRLANSALFGFPRRVGALSDAVVLLGFHTIKSLALAGAAFTVMDRAVEGYGLQRGFLWRHGMAAAAASRLLARRRAKGLVEEAFVGGLLHDVGKIILDTYVAAEFATIVQQVREEGKPFVVAEREVLGFSHTDVGGAVAEAWALPEPLSAAIRYHHAPSLYDGDARLPSLVHLGNVVAVSTGFGIGVDGLACPLDGNALTLPGLEVADIEAAISEMPEAMADSEQLFEL